MKRIVLSFLVVVCMVGLLSEAQPTVSLTGSAQAAVQLVYPPTTDTVQLHGEKRLQSLVLNHLFLATPSGTLKVLFGACPGDWRPNPPPAGCAEPDQGVLYFDSGTFRGLSLGLGQRFNTLKTLDQADDFSDVALLATHEIGHIVDAVLNGSDYTVMTPLRERFMRAAGISGPWYLPYPQAGGDEAWADWYSACATSGLESNGPKPLQSDGYDLKLSVASYNKVCAFFREALVGPGLDGPGATPASAIPYNRANSSSCAARSTKYPFNEQQCSWEVWTFGNRTCYGPYAVCDKRVTRWSNAYQAKIRHKCRNRSALWGEKCIPRKKHKSKK